MNYIGQDVHEKTISYCVKDSAGRRMLSGYEFECGTFLPLAFKFQANLGQK